MEGHGADWPELDLGVKGREREGRRMCSRSCTGGAWESERERVDEAVRRGCEMGISIRVSDEVREALNCV